MQVATSNLTPADNTAEIWGAVRIGNGTKLHRAYKDPRFGLIICCSCAGTSQGSAYNHARFFAGVQSNCKN